MDLPVSGDCLNTVIDWGAFGTFGDIVLTGPSFSLVIHSWKVPIVGDGSVGGWDVLIVPETELEMVLVNLVFPWILVLVEKDVLMMAASETSYVGVQGASRVVLVGKVTLWLFKAIFAEWENIANGGLADVIFLTSDTHTGLGRVSNKSHRGSRFTGMVTKLQ
jgi:hypothetical protein